MSQLYLVSAGPGDAAYLTPAAQRALENSHDLVAYGLYLSLLGECCEGKRHHQLPLGQEIERARLALNLAAKGQTTALISSGDVGIYAMATLVFELLAAQQAGSETPEADWQQVAIEVIPGISAMQAAASRAGALLNHDFCTISLSDLLTPWQTIQKRIHSAGTGDFVVSFYNPRSKNRDWQLAEARDILLKYRPPHTPVILGRQLTREDEQVHFTTLGELDITQVDMFTLVSVGNSETQTLQHQNRTWAYTPRGYSKKL